MFWVSIAEAKAHLSALVKRVEQGATLFLTRHNRPVAEIRPVAAAHAGDRPYGLARGKVEVHDDFNAPLPDEILDAFEGR